MTLDDEKYCLQEMSRGNKSAFEWLFLTWHPKVVVFFKKFIEDEETAYDYAQDVFYDVWAQRKKFSEVESFSAFLFRMAKFRLFNHYDKQAVKSKFVKEGIKYSSDDSVPMEQSVFADEMERMIWDTVNSMPPKRRKVFVMSRMQGYSNEEIARELGISKRTVENHITSALAILRGIVKSVVVLCVMWCNVYL